VTQAARRGRRTAHFTQDKIVLRFFTWDLKAQSIEAIDTLADSIHLSTGASGAGRGSSEIMQVSSR
jgi:hypothetical protein